MMVTPVSRITTVPAASSHIHSGHRFFRRAVTVVLIASLVAGIGLFLRLSFEQATLREAYLPELEPRANRETSNGPLLALLAIRLCEAGQYSRASVRFEQATGAGENNPLLWQTWAAATAASGDINRAQAILKLGIARNRAAASTLQEALDRMDSAPHSAAAAAEAIYPDGVRQASRYYTRGNFWNGVLAEEGRRNPAHSGFATRQEWADQEPDNPTAQRLWGEALLTNERFAEAETVLRKAAALLPSDAEVQAALGDALRGQNRGADASRSYKASLALAKDNRRALLGMGRLMLERKLIRLAVPVLEKATTLYPDSADAWVLLGQAHYTQHLNFTGAVQAFEKAKALAPGRTDFFDDYSNALRAAGRYAEAESILAARLKAAPTDARAQYLRGLLLLDFDQTPERRHQAELAFRESLRLEPDNVAVQGRLGQLLADADRGEEAIPLLQSALQANNRNIAQLRSLAAAYRQTGQSERAETVMESLKELTAYLAQVESLQDQIMVKPEDSELHRKLADLLERGGDGEKARFHREVVAMLKTHPEKAKQALLQLSDAMANITK